MFVKLIRYLHYVILWEYPSDTNNRRCFHGVLKTCDYQLLKLKAKWKINSLYTRTRISFMFEKCRIFQRLCSTICYFMTKFPSIKVTYLNFKGFSRLLNNTFDSELSFVSRQTMHQYHLRKSATCSSRNIFNNGVSLTPSKIRETKWKARSVNCGWL